MARPPDASGSRSPGPWRRGFEIPLRPGDSLPDVPASVTWLAAGATIGFIVLGGVGATIGAGCGLLGHVVSKR